MNHRNPLLWQRGYCLAYGIGLVALSGCEPPALQTLEGLTILSVEASPPTAQPGQDVQLRLHYFDRKSFELSLDASDSSGDAGAPAAEAPQVVWFGGCHNPPGDSALGCLPLFTELAEAAAAINDGADLSEIDPTVLEQLGFGDQFTVHIPDTPVAERVRRAELIPFGVSFAFFAACRGQLVALDAARERIPVGCVDETGDTVDDDDFTIGYVTIYVYDDLVSEPPKVTGVKLDGERVESAGCDSDADCSELGNRLRYRCTQDQCVPRVKRCGNDCQSHQVAPIVDPASAELDPTTVSIGEEPKHELVWVNYHAVGTLDRRESLIFDRDGNESGGYAAEWTPPRRGGFVAPLFGVVRDSRGGSTTGALGVWIDE